MNTAIVKIIKAEEPTVWYANKISLLVEVNISSDCYRVLSPVLYLDLKINKDDCEILKRVYRKIPDELVEHHELLNEAIECLQKTIKFLPKNRCLDNAPNLTTRIHNIIEKHKKLNDEV